MQRCSAVPSHPCAARCEPGNKEGILEGWEGVNLENSPTFSFLWHSLGSLQVFGAGQAQGLLVHNQGLVQILRAGQKGAPAGESKRILVKNAPEHLELRGFPALLSSLPQMNPQRTILHHISPEISVLSEAALPACDQTFLCC